MHGKISKKARAEVIELLRKQYSSCSKEDKTKIIDEFVLLTGYHRKHAIRILSFKSDQTSDREVYGCRI